MSEPTQWVWVVRYENYDPAEVDSIWTTEAGAKTRQAELDGDWRVEQWELKV
jgi:hypothetical protein